MTTTNEMWAETYVDLLDRIVSHGDRRDSRAGMTKDVGPTHIELPAPPDFCRLSVRRGLVGFAEAEQLTYVTGGTPKQLLPWAPSYTKYGSWNEERGDWDFLGSYGPRLAVELPKVVRIIDKDRRTRQAIVHIHQPHDVDRVLAGPPKSVDIPCTLALNLWMAPEGLRCHAMMRSTDAWFGIYHDLPAFGFIQAKVAEALSVPAGRLAFTTSSLHLYEEHWERATAQVDAGPLIEGTSGLLAPFLSGQGGDPVMRFGVVVAFAAKRLDEMTRVRLAHNEAKAKATAK